MAEFNAQDAYAKLVEDIRIGLIGRPLAIPGGTKYVPFRPDIDMNVPVFHLTGEWKHVPLDEGGAAIDALIQREFHLPYSRCAFMMSLPGTHSGLQHLKPRFHVRHTYVLLMEEDDEQVHIVPFMKNELMPHWARQLFDIYFDFASGDISTMYDPAWGTFPPGFIMNVEGSLWSRMITVMANAHKMMMTRSDESMTNAAKVITGSEVTTKINGRREKMNLPPVPRVITIDLTAPPSVPTRAATGKGTTKRAHFRRGSWHTRKATGIRSWHPPVAVHGGGEVVPPWYEVKTPH